VIPFPDPPGATLHGGPVRLRPLRPTPC